MSKINLVLSSGGWRGLAHIGVIKALCEANIEIANIVGSSAGSLIGGSFAVDADINRVEHFFNHLTYQDLAGVLLDVGNTLGITQTTFFKDFVTKLVGKHTFPDCQIGFHAVATNIITGQPTVFNQGELRTAIQASCAFPGVLPPVKLSGQIYLDGGTSSPLPTYQASQISPHPIVAVNLFHNAFPQKTLSRSYVHNTTSTIRCMAYNLASQNEKLATVIISPDIEHDMNPFLRFINNPNAINAGYLAAKNQLDEIKQAIKYSDNLSNSTL